MKLVAIVQARTGSTRLPGKVLLPVRGKTILERMLERVLAAKELDEVMVATPEGPADEPIRALCRRMGVLVYAGHETDLLDRHFRAGRERGAEAVAKIPSDCPLIDPRVIDRVAARFRSLAETGVDFVSNLHPASYPDGNDVEIVSMPALEIAWREAARPLEREHTTPFIWDQPERFRLENVAWESDRDLSMSHRFTLDYPEDYAFIAAVYDRLHREGAFPFSLADILRLLEEQPEIFRINSHLAGVNWYRNHLAELRTVGAHETAQYQGRR